MHRYRIVNGRAVFEGFTTEAANRLTRRERRAVLRQWVAPIVVASVMSIAALPILTRTAGPAAASRMVARATVASTCGLIRWLIDRWTWEPRRVGPFRPVRGWTSS